MIYSEFISESFDFLQIKYFMTELIKKWLIIKLAERFTTWITELQKMWPKLGQITQKHPNNAEEWAK